MKTTDYKFQWMPGGQKISIQYPRKNGIMSWLYVTPAEIKREALTGDERYVKALAWLEQQKGAVV